MLISAFFIPAEFGLATTSSQASSYLPAWHVSYDDPGAFVGVSCINASDCISVGTEGYVAQTTDQAKQFLVNRVLPYGSLLVGVSCVGSTCYAVGQQNGNEAVVVKSTNFGLSWSAPIVLNYLNILNSISCVNATTCVAVGSTGSAGAIVTTTNGQTFTAQNVVAGVVNLSGVSCASVSYCVAVGSMSSGSTTVGALLYSTNFTTYSQATIPASTNLNAVSCVINSTYCYAAGSLNTSEIIISSAQAGNWILDSSPKGPSSINAISCVSPDICVAVSPDGYVLDTFAGGYSWFLDPRAPGAIAGYLGLNCPSSSFCMLSGQQNSGVGNLISVSLNQSGNSYYLNSIAQDLSIFSVSCPTVTNCVAVAFSNTGSEVLSTTNATASVDIVSTSLYAYFLLSVSCPSASNCMAVGDNATGSPVVLVSLNGGISWSNVSPNIPNSGVSLLTSVDCPSTSTCYATDTNGHVISTTNFGGSFSVASTPLLSQGGILYSISCATTTSCFVSGSISSNGSQGVIYLTTNGTNWSLSLIDQQASAFYTINCINGSSITCYAGGAGSSGALIVQTTSSGSSWASLAIPGGLSSIASISCISASVCVAVDESGAIISSSNSGATWQQEKGPFNIETLATVSCVTNYQCFAAGGSVLLSTTPSISLISPSSGPLGGGSTVTIYGSGFSSVTSVLFGSNYATNLSVINDTELTVTVPAGSSLGFVNVVVVNSISGPSLTVSGDGYIYVAGGDTIEVNPVRICDTRVGATDPSTYAGQRLGPGDVLNVGVINANSDNVPSGAEAVIINVTAVNPTATSYLTIFPTGVGRPNASTLNFNPSEVAQSSLTEVPLGQNGSISIYNAFGSVDVLVDVEGYVEPNSASASTFVPFGPKRVADTRSYPSNSYQDASNYLNPGSSINVQIAGYSNIPTNAIGVVINITVTQGSSAGGYVTVYPTGSSLPNTSNINFGPNEAIANRDVVKLGGNGSITVTTEVSGCNVIIDVDGYFLPSSSGALYYPVSPNRIVDSRSYVGNSYQLAGTYLTPNNSYTFQVGGYQSDGIPTTAIAFTATATVVYTQTSGGYLSFYPFNSTTPDSSDINWTQGLIIANMIVVGISQNDTSVYDGVSGTDLIVDVSGYYQ